MVVEEAASTAERNQAPRPAELLCSSARTPGALQEQRKLLTDYLRTRPDAALSDVAFTLQVGRAEFRERAALVCASAEDTASGQWTLGSAQSQPPHRTFVLDSNARVCWEFYTGLPPYRSEIDRVLAIVSEETGGDLRAAMALLDSSEAMSGFAGSWAMGRTLITLGVTPQNLAAAGWANIAAAALAGVFPLKDAVAVVLCGCESGRFRRVRLRAPELPLLSPSGSIAGKAESMDPAYWISTLTAPLPPLDDAACLKLNAISGTRELLSQLGGLWVNGASIDWPALYLKGSVGRVPLPHYPFQRRHFATRIDAPAPAVQPTSSAHEPTITATASSAVWNVDAVVEKLRSREPGILAAHPCRSVDAEAGLRDRLEAYCAGRIYDLFATHGGMVPEVMIRSRDLAQRMGVTGDSMRLYQYLLTVLARARDATILDTRIRFRNAAPGRSRRIALEIGRDSPLAQSLIDLVDSCIQQLPDALRGNATAGMRDTAEWRATAEWRQDDAIRALAEEACAALRLELDQEILPISEGISSQENLGAALADFRMKASAKGAALLIERTRVETWDQLALGLSPSWWGFDAGRGPSPALSFTQWEAAALAAGFAQVIAFPGESKTRETSSLGLFLLIPNAANGGDLS